jgi:hypothetical protein
MSDEGRERSHPLLFSTETFLRCLFGPYFLIALMASSSILTPALEAAIDRDRFVLHRVVHVGVKPVMTGRAGQFGVLRALL